MTDSFDFLNLVSVNVLPFIMVITRIGSIFFTIPPFRNNGLPHSVKLLFSLAVTLLVFPLVGIELNIMELSYFEIFYYLFSEFLLGLVISFMVTIVFAAIQLAGRIIDLNSGFGFSNLVDPVTQDTITVTSKFYSVVAATLFFLIGGHRLLLQAALESYRLIPLGSFRFSQQALNILIRAFGDIFIIGFRIAAPIMAALFLTEVALAILSRAIPQIRVFLIGFPLKISVTFLIIALTLINTVPYLQGLFEDSFVNIQYFLKLFTA